MLQLWFTQAKVAKQEKVKGVIIMVRYGLEAGK